MTSEKPSPGAISKKPHKPGRGGARKGAGRKAGIANKKTQKQMREALRGGQMPLEYMLGVMRDEKAAIDRRDDMARACAPYLHPRLQVTQHQGDPLQPVIFQMINRAPKEKRK